VGHDPAVEKHWCKALGIKIKHKIQVCLLVMLSAGFFGETDCAKLLELISPTIYEQLLFVQIPNAKKRQSSQQCRLALLAPTSVKAFMRAVPECAKKDSQVIWRFCVQRA